MNKTHIPVDYQSKLNLYDTQTAIGFIKNVFQEKLAFHLHLKRVSAPLFVEKESGLNDGLNGEEPVRFHLKSLQTEAEVVHSLAKWKRMALYSYDFHVGNGLYTDMNAIRKEEVPDNLHSFYVDQWDWEKVIDQKSRTLDFLKKTVKEIVLSIHETSKRVRDKYPQIEYLAPKDVYFIDAQSLEDMYPHLSSMEREEKIVKKHQCVFIMKIGYPLKGGHPHDLRAPDYDDWALNGDLIYYHKTLDMAVEISSMGIRVNHESLYQQLQFLNRLDDLKYGYHQSIMKDILPQSIGGGIGQSRLCLLLLEKAHIGEVQVSIWDQETLDLCKDKVILI